MLLVFAGQAGAANPKHPFIGPFGSVNEPTFATAGGLAVDQSTGDVLVLDVENKTLSRWHADGTPSNFSALGTNVIDGQGSGDGTPQNGILGEYADIKETQVAVDNSGGPTDGNIYVTDSSHGVIDIFGSDGTYLGQLTAAGSSSFVESCGVAVDPDGNVFVAEYGGQIHKFLPSGAVPVNSDNTLNFVATEPCTMAAGAGPTAGSLFVASWGGPVTKFDATTGAEEYVVDSGSSVTVNVDPATGHVYVATGEVVKEYDASGASSPTLVSTISTASTFTVFGVAIDETSGKVYVSRGGVHHLEVFGPLVYGEAPVVSTGGTTGIGNDEATVHGTVDPNEDATTWQFEYGPTKAYGSVAPVSPQSAGEGGDPVPVSTALSGLQAGTEYHYRLRATNPSGSIVGDDMTFTTAAPALVETTGSPLRTATSARLEGRVAPRGAATTYHFEYGDEGPCDSNPCQSTPARSAGSGDEYVLVSEQVSGLQPGTTYHYRLVAGNGNIAGNTPGGDMTVTTRASDAPPAPAPYPGPPGSDRGWEQVNVPDTGGNPVQNAMAISDNGDRVVYHISGGIPGGPTGTFTSLALAERTASGWQPVDLLPPREELIGPLWLMPLASSDLSTVDLFNFGAAGTSMFRINWPSGWEHLYEAGSIGTGQYMASADASRVIMALKGNPDPEHSSDGRAYLYDVSSGQPHMISLLPDGTVPPCGLGIGGEYNKSSGMPGGAPARSAGWVSSDGSYAIFPSESTVCNNVYQLYLRNLVAGTTSRITASPISGPTCNPRFIRGTDDAVFFWTQSRLVPEDTMHFDCPDSAEGGDIYRYDIASGSLDCVTCISASVETKVQASRLAWTDIAIPSDGSRVYFKTDVRLLPGAARPGIYRINVATGALRYIAPGGDTYAGMEQSDGNAITPDGSVFVFRSGEASLNSIGGLSNGDTMQYYRYDDRNRSLVCLSCPQDGSSPHEDTRQIMLADSDESGPNITPIDNAGDVAFVTSTPLVSADTNSAGVGQERSVGNDVYEWRDGRLFLVTDGHTQWKSGETGARLSGITPSGGDILFSVPEALTADAPDAYPRLYDARIGGGFPPPPSAPGCGVEACPEGPKGQPGAPETVAPGSAAFSGPEDPKPHLGRHKHRKKHHHRRHHDQKHKHPKAHRPQITESRRTNR